MSHGLSPPEANDAPQKPSSHVAILTIVIILSLASLAAAGYFYYQKSKILSELNPELTEGQPTTVPTPQTVIFQGHKFPYSFSYPSFFKVILDPYKSDSDLRQETVNLINNEAFSPVKLIEFRTLEAYFPDSTKENATPITINETKYWYGISPEYENGQGLVQVFTEFEKN